MMLILSYQHFQLANQLLNLIFHLFSELNGNEHDQQLDVQFYHYFVRCYNQHLLGHQYQHLKRQLIS